MKKLHLLWWAVPAVAVAAAAWTSATQPGRAPAFGIEQLIDINHPSSPVWSPDGRRVAFLWDRAGVTNLFVADAGGGQPRALTAFASEQVGNIFWSHDGAKVYFVHDGDLWQADARGGQPRAVWTTADVENGVVQSPDGSRVAFVRWTSDAVATRRATARLVVRSLVDATERVVAHDDHSIFALSWAPDGRHLAYAAGSDSIRHEQTPAYSGAKIIYTITERTPPRNYVVGVDGGEPVAIGQPGGFGGVRWVDASHVVFDRQSADFKRRTIYDSEIGGGEPRVLHEDVDEKFWSIPGDALAGPQPSPDGKWLVFVSDRDGWDHLYITPIDRGATLPPSRSEAASQITKGHFEAWRPSWSPDSTRIAFDANDPEHPGTRQIGIATIGGDPAKATVRMITTGRGTNTWPSWSPDGRQILYQHTDPQNSADLFAMDVPDARAVDQLTRVPRRLSNSMPTAISKDVLVEPELVHYAGPDGQQVPAWLFVPRNLDKSKKHPAIVWIHGDGINQNYDGWHVQRNYAVYYSFHQYLLQKGYVVIAPDYRGSIGYGRGWRQGVYMDVGGNDAKDAWMAAGYLKTLPYVDADRLGVWGLSYGGFFTLIAMTDQPRLFRAGVDVAGVVDYAMYYEDPYHGGWTASRIGTPEQNPKVYAQASPLSHVDRLERPLLVLHGTSDVNVPYLHSVRLIDELLKKGKSGLVSFMTYPGEFHYFTREHVLRDAWHRVDDFFDRELRGGTVSTH